MDCGEVIWDPADLAAEDGGTGNIRRNCVGGKKTAGIFHF